MGIRRNVELRGRENSRWNPMKKRVACIVLSLAALAANAEVSGDKGFDIPRAEFAKYYRR